VAALRILEAEMGHALKLGNKEMSETDLANLLREKVKEKGFGDQLKQHLKHHGGDSTVLKTLDKRATRVAEVAASMTF